MVPYNPDDVRTIPTDQTVPSSQERVGEVNQDSMTISDATEPSESEESMSSTGAPDEPSTPDFPGSGGGEENRLPLVSESLGQQGQYWRSDRLDFLLRIFSVYTHSLRVLQSLREAFNEELCRREKELDEREKKLWSEERQTVSQRSLSAWASQLSTREAELFSREDNFEVGYMAKLQKFLLEIEEWGLHASSDRRPPRPFSQ